MPHCLGLPFRVVLALVLVNLAGDTFGQADQADSKERPYQVKTIAGVDKIRLLPPGPGNPRNSEGDFIQLKDGSLLFIYTHFTGGGSDHAAAHLAARRSTDGGISWSDEDRVILEQQGGFNVMSVSLLRLKSGAIALFYLKKESLTDCRPFLRLSHDEAQTWSEPIECIREIGYNVLNNDRAVQLSSGRIILPVALHNTPERNKFSGSAIIRCHYSDDDGRTWHASSIAPHERGRTLQEPGIVQLKDGRLMMFCRTPHGSQYVAYSRDDGTNWSTFGPSRIISPLSPATIERLPNGDLLMAWNNHDQVTPEYRGKRTPLCVAISQDEGASWVNVKTLEDDPNGWYCYTAMTIVDDHVLLGHCAGDRRKGGLNTTQITRFPIAWLYSED